MLILIYSLANIFRIEPSFQESLYKTFFLLFTKLFKVFAYYQNTFIIIFLFWLKVTVFSNSTLLKLTTKKEFQQFFSFFIILLSISSVALHLTSDFYKITLVTLLFFTLKKKEIYKTCIIQIFFIHLSLDEVEIKNKLHFIRNWE